MPADPWVYILTRRDLPPGVAAVQAVHAASYAARHFTYPDSETPNVVLLAVPDEPALHAAVRELADLPTRYYAFREPDMDCQLTAVAFEPVGREGRKAFRKYPLF